MRTQRKADVEYWGRNEREREAERETDKINSYRKTEKGGGGVRERTRMKWLVFELNYWWICKNHFRKKKYHLPD